MKLIISGYAEQVNEREKESEKHKRARGEKIKKRIKKIALVAIPAMLIILWNVISLISHKHALRELRDVQVGDYIIFGQYEQDNKRWNGPEDIEWIVEPRRVRCFRMNNTDDMSGYVVPLETQYAMKLESSEPIVVQYGRLDNRQTNLAYYTTLAF